MKTDDCVVSLKQYLENSSCHQFHTVERGQWDYFIKCAGAIGGGGAGGVRE